MQIDLHCESFELCIFAYSFDVSDSQTDEEIHQQDWHENNEHDQKEKSREPLNFIDVHDRVFLDRWNRSKKCADKVDLSKHHCAHSDHRQYWQTKAFAQSNNIKLGKKNVETQAKSNDENREEKDHLKQSRKNLEKHYHVDSTAVETLQEEQQIEPRNKDWNGRADVEITRIDIEEQERDYHRARGNIQHPLKNVDGLFEVTPSLHNDHYYNWQENKPKHVTCW